MNIRQAAVAGQFYPGEAGQLHATIQSLMQSHGDLVNGLATPDKKLDAKAILVPHAGYVYSGAAAAAVFSSVHLPSRIIIICPNHTGYGAELALAPAGRWKTPLGLSAIDAEMNEALLGECQSLREDDAAHRHDHAIEVQLPFLQVLRPDFRFSAICVRTVDYKVLESLGHAMARVIGSSKGASKEPVFLVISSDMTHYVSADTAARQDRMALDCIEAIDPHGLYETVISNDITMCGFAPAVAVLTTCLDLGATAGETICYTNSGEASGDYDHVVAYAGVVIN